MLKTLRHFGQLASTFDNVNCNFLYVSACFLLRNDGLKRGDLPDEEVVLKLSAPMLLFTIERMPNLRRVVAMGEVARRALNHGALQEQIKAKKLARFDVKHPSYAMSDDARFEEWEPVFAGFGAEV